VSKNQPTTSVKTDGAPDALTPRKMLDMVKAARKASRDITDTMSQVIRQYAGEHYRKDSTPDDPIWINHPYEFVTNVLPNLVFDNPAVSVTLDGGTSPEAESIDAAFRYIINKTDFTPTIESLARDALFGFSVACVHLEDVPGAQPELSETGEVFIPQRPKLTRLSPRRFFVDPAWDGVGVPAFAGHIWLRSRDAFNPDDGWDMTIVDNVPKNDSVAEERRAVWHEHDEAGWDDEVVGYEVWCSRDNMLYTGVIGNAEAWAREPRPYKGSRRGPYRIGGIDEVPDQPYPLSPLAVTYKLVDKINSLANVIAEEAETAKTQVITDSTELAEKMARTATAKIITHSGFNPQTTQTYSYGGTNAQSVAFVEQLMEKLDRQSGLSEIIRGNIGSGTTATAVATAKAASDIRIRKMQSKFRKFVIECLQAMAELMWEHPDVKMPVLVEDSNTGETIPHWFVGGTFPGQDENGWERLEIVIEPYSMEPVDEALLQKRVQEFVAFAMQITQSAAVMPWMRLENILDDVGQTLNMRGSGRRYVDVGMLRQLIQAQMGVAQMAPGQPGSAPLLPMGGAAGPVGLAGQSSDYAGMNTGIVGGGQGVSSPAMMEAARLQGQVLASANTLGQA